MKHYLEVLTEAQRAAVLHGDGPAIVVSGPGSGKTRTITYRIVHLVDSGTYPGNIAAITFTNKAAKEMRQRVDSILPKAVAERVHISTFHSFCAKLLRMEYQAAKLHPKYSICDEDAASFNMLQALCSLTGEDPKEIKRWKDYRGPEYCKWFVEYQKQRMVTPDMLLEAAVNLGQEGKEDTYLRQAYEKYQSILERARSLDFEDLIMKVALLLKDNEFIREKYATRIKHLLVDEYQDTNYSQFVLSTLLCSHWHNIFAVGDPDQSIYRFRGADYTNINRLEEHYKDKLKTYFLQENFRSTKAIAAAANVLIKNNLDRKPKDILSVGEEGEKARCVEAYDSSQEAAFAVDEIKTLVDQGKARYRDFAVIYRVHSRSRLYEELMVANNIPHRVVGGLGFYNRAVVKDMLAYLKLIENEYDDASFMRIYDAPPRGFGDNSYYKLYEHKEKTGDSFIKILREEQYRDVLVGKSKKAQIGAKKLKDLFDKLASVNVAKVGPIVDLLIHETGYRNYLLSINDDSVTNKSEHLDELIASTYEFDSTYNGGLSRYLEWVALMQSDDKEDKDPDKVTLLTCHAAKGLEFKNVYLVGAVEKSLPIIRDLDKDGNPKSEEEMRQDLEEERRVCYVGMTRAEKNLTITYSLWKITRGRAEPCVRSPFIEEMEGTLDLIPVSDLCSVGAPQLAQLSQYRHTQGYKPILRKIPKRRNFRNYYR